MDAPPRDRPGEQLTRCRRLLVLGICSMSLLIVGLDTTIVNVTLTLYLQDVRGLSPFHAGLYTLPMAGMMCLFAPLSGRVVGQRGARPSLLFGGGAMLLGGLMLTQLSPSTSTGFLLLAYLLFGAGSGLVNPPITNTAVSGMPPAQAGVAAAIASTGRQVGMTLGVATVGAVAGAGLGNGLGQGFAEAAHPGWWIIVALVVLVLILGLLTTTEWAKQTAQRTAKRLASPPAQLRASET